MPVVPYKLDVGFRVPAWVPPPLANVPDKKSGGGLFQFGENWKYITDQTAAEIETYGAAFQLENAVINSWEFLTKPTFSPDPNFDLEANLKAANMWDDFRWNYVGVQSPGEFLYKTRQILREKKNREILSAAGPQGVLAAMVAGSVDPTILLPFVGAGKGVGRAVLTGLAWGAAAGTLQEIPLQLNQELRTLEESGISVGFSTLIGGVLGGGVGYLNKSLAKMSDDMGVVPGTSYVSPLAERILIDKRLAELDAAGKKARPGEDLTPMIEEATQLESRLRELDLDEARLAREAEVDLEISHSAVGTKSDLGADALESGAGGLKKMLGIGERLTRIAGPVTSVLGQKISKQGQWMMAQLSTAGLRLEKNLILDSNGEIIGALPSTEGGGTVEGLIMSRRGETLQQIDKAYDQYANYMLGKGQGQGPFRRSRAGLKGQFAGGPKLNRRQFFEAVGEAMWRGDVSPIPEVQAVAQNFRQYMNDLLKEAQDLGIISDEIKEVAPDQSFLNRVYDTEAIKRNPQRFTKILADHFEQELKGDLERLHSAFLKSDQADRLRLADFDLPLAEAQKIRTAALEELKAINELEDNPAALEQMISDLRGQMKKDTGERKKLEADMAKMTMLRDKKPLQDRIDEIALERERIHERINELKQLGGDDLEQRTLRKRELKARIRNLNRSRFMVEERARAKYDKMEDLEEQNIDALERVVSSGSKLLKKLDKSDESFGKELSGLQAAVGKAGTAMSKFEAQIDALEATRKAKGEEAGAPVDPADEINRQLFKKDVALSRAKERFEELWDNLADFENINWVERGRAEARGAIQDALTESVTRLNAQLEKRYARIAKLEKQAEKFDAAGWAAKKAEIEERIRARKEKALEKARALGADDFDINTGVVDVRRHAEEIADLARTRIQGLNVRLAGFDAMSDARGTELARTLSVDSLKLANEGFLVSDAEHLLHVYANTLIPDIEIVRRFGAFAPDGERNLQFTKLNEEQFMVERRAVADLEAKAKAAGKEVDKKELGDLMRGIGKEYDGIRKNLDASIRRLRNQWVIASDPDSLATRMTQTVLSMQALRFLGTVGLSSIPDIARPVMRYGLGRTMQAAWVPMINNWRAIKMTADEARRAFVAVESATAHRAFQVSELMDFARRRTKVESALQWTTSKVGIIAGFSPWTDLMKTLSSMTLNMKIMDSIDLSLNAVKTGKDRLEAVEFLNSLGLSQDYQKRIWDEMMNGGAERIKGVWVPQTERWTDKAAIRAYRAALYSEGAASIITPGLELPKIVNASLPGKLFFNLKSFALASTSKTLMAGLQQRDAAVFTGIMVSMALGALSFYLKSVIAGGAAQERMEKSVDEGNWELWVDEALDASGLLGVLSMVQRVAQDVPGVRNAMSVSGVSNTLQGKPPAQTLRSSGSGLIEDIAGPTADLAFTMAQVITGLDKPTRAQVHRVRQLLPFQNVFYLRRLFDQVENIVGDAAHLKGQRR